MANKYKRKSEPMNRWIALVMALISIFMGTAFSSTRYFNQPIDRKDATQLNCTYKESIVHTQRGSIREIKLLFHDGSAQYIDGSCSKYELSEKLKIIPSGTKFKMLVNPNNDYIVELIVNDEVLLNFDYAQKQLERNGVGFFYLGIVMYVFAVIFIIQAILDFKKEIKKQKQRKLKNKAR